jgi:hypothetical protein
MQTNDYVRAYLFGTHPKQMIIGKLITPDSEGGWTISYRNMNNNPEKERYIYRPEADIELLSDEEIVQYKMEE